MSDRKPETTSSQPKQPPQSRRGARVDNAHHVPREDSPPTEPAEDQLQAQSADASAEEQLQRQASQLATHLRGEQRQLDEREAELNARTAQFEHDVRNWRLVLEEKRRAVDEREQELQTRIAEIERQAAAISAAAALTTTGLGQLGAGGAESVQALEVEKSGQGSPLGELCRQRICRSQGFD